MKPVTPVRSHLLRNDVAALERDRLTWTDSNYIRDETIREANAILVAAQNSVPLVNIWGDGEMASIKRTKNEIDS
ncbi:Tn3 family transposase [Bartonella sp. CDC_skunk]|uniref:Tn3 family transposase n=1 Tax=Bartonella TaxID=773 RepID=UPI000999D96F